MKTLFLPILSSLLFLCSSPDLFSQSDCTNATYIKRIGSSASVERGLSLAYSLTEDVIYIAGSKDDSVSILKLNATDEVEWIRTFDIVPGKSDHIHKMIVDSDGMIVASGVAGPYNTLGVVFAFRYDPVNDNMIWAKTYLSYTNCFNHGLEELTPGAHFLMSNNPAVPGNNDAQLIMLNRQSGDIMPEFSFHYDVGDSEALNDLVLHDGFLYANGRYTDGPDFRDMRSTTVKIDPVTGAPVWTILGHVPGSASARLYGAGMIIAKDEIFSISVGDENGTSTDFTDIWMQKTNLDGEVQWMKKYDLPGTSDWIDEIISSEGGFVLLARNRLPPSDIIMFKVDRDGNLLWANKFDFTDADNSLVLGGIQGALRQVGQHIYFTAFAEKTGDADLILVKTNLEGEVDDTCGVVAPVEIIVTPVQNPVFYNVDPFVFTFNPEIVTQFSHSVTGSVPLINTICFSGGFIRGDVTKTICQGTQYEGYTNAGIYTDTFHLVSGCDSIRTLHLEVTACAQDDCQNDFFRIFGSLIENERGYSLSASLDQQSVYVGGIKGDSAVILNISTSGEVLWTRSFDIVPGKPDHIYRVLTDTDGMIGVSGIAGSQQTGGTIFVFRYDPSINKVLWAKELVISGSNFNLGMIEIGPGGNYLVTNNPVSPNVAELVELDKSNGQVINTFSKRYDLGSSETIYDLIYHNGQLYGTGRFSDGGSTAEMRNTLLRLDPSNGAVGWMKLGHRTASQTSRFYGVDVVVAQDELFSVYLGDDGGTSIDNTQIYMQRTGLDGALKWIKQYELPGINDWVDEIIDSDGGLVVLARNRIAPSDLFLFKTDYSGNIVWAKRYDYAYNDNAVSLGAIQSQLIESDGHLYFTAFAEENGNADLIIVRTNLKGVISDTCAASFDVSIPVTNVSNPVFYTKSAIITNTVPQQNSLSVDAGFATTLQGKTICSNEIATQSNLDIMICTGDMYEGYSQQGIYIDTFTSQEGCDSIRILHLEVADVLQSIQGIEICPGQMYEGYTQPGMYMDTFTTTAGCDSVRTLILTVVIPELYIDQAVCAGGQFEGYTPPGMFVDTLFGPPGNCDTIRYLTLTVAPPIQSSVAQTICEGEEYFGYTITGRYTDTLTNSQGCDSIRTVMLNVASPTESVVQAELCEAYTYGYTNSGTYTDTLTSFLGCDSLRTLIIRDSEFYIPNVFSPNDDGLNDLFEIIAYPVDALTLTYFVIFDRYGNMAHETYTMPVQWNGTGKNGKPYNPGVYTYLLKYNCQNEEQVLTGDITLVR